MTPLSHRSHDNIGYVASPLIESLSDNTSSVTSMEGYNVRKAHSATAHFLPVDDKEVDEIERQRKEEAHGSSEGELDEDAMIVDSEEEGIPHEGGALVR